MTYSKVDGQEEGDANAVVNKKEVDAEELLTAEEPVPAEAAELDSTMSETD